MNILAAFALSAVAVSALASAPASAQQTMPLWPHGTPEPAQTSAPETSQPASNRLEPGVALDSLSNVTVPTLTIYPVPAGIHPTGAAAVVLPGGGYQHLAFILEGVQPCQWFNSLGVFCVAVKYRVPWSTRYPANTAPLEDAQQAMRLVRSHATTWHIDPHRIGVLGFSAGGHLAVTLSQHFDDTHVLSTPAAADVTPAISARPDFVLLGYPAYLPGGNAGLTLDPALAPNAQTPPTFIVQAEDDKTYIDSSLVYFRALKDAGIPAELHIFTNGGHGFGMHPRGVQPEHWTDLAAAWLTAIHVLPAR